MTTSPLLTLSVCNAMRTARRADAKELECSMDLERSRTTVTLGADHWEWQGAQYPYLETCRDRTIYYWAGDAFAPVSRYTSSLIKLVPTEWGTPTFEIDGIKMLVSQKVSPWQDAERKVGLVQPRGKRVLDTCGGLGYFAEWCLRGKAEQVHSFEKNPDVLWLRELNPWSPSASPELTVTQGDVAKQITGLESGSVDAILHDPPRFGIAGELYSQVFYDELTRVIRRKGRLFHYTGSPNKLTSGRDVPNEVANRLRRAGFATELEGDGVLATKR